MWTLRGSRGSRLIPAHAGKTSQHGRTPIALTAHPRSRGENPRDALTRSSQGGSSPLTRGKRNLTEDLVLDTRLIPAHAGKTSVFAGPR